MQVTVQSSHLKFLMRAALPVGALALCGVLLAQQVSVDHLQDMPDRLGDISPWRWALALAFTLGSFWAVAQYDALAHRVLGTGVSQKRARITGMIGIALGQTLGLGVVTGALARWRMLCDLSLAGAARVSAYVSVTFVLCWAVVAAFACLVMPAPDWTFWPAVAIIGAIPLIAATLFLLPVINIMGVTVHLPNLRISGASLFWALVDTCFAAAALYVLLPSGTLAFSIFLPLFLIALGCGLVSNTPGGVGPFELILISALPLGDPTPIMAAILGYRIIYYALPAVVAGLALLRPFTAASEVLAQPIQNGNMNNDIALIAQNDGTFAQHGQSALALWSTGQTMAQFCDPLDGTGHDALDHLRHAARDTLQLPLIYKCSAHMATTARRAQWKVLHIADEAMISPPSYDINTPAFRTLRRKLRSATKAKVTIREGHPLPFAALARVDGEWQMVHGRARGGSMGRYCPDFVARQWVGCAYVDGRLVGFVTAHRGAAEWRLDVMRHSENVPDGTMHSLVNAAILAAKRAGAEHFSLDAVPACPNAQSPFWTWLAKHVTARAGGLGLRQFKSCFAPVWVPRYAAARSWGAMVLCLADITRAIHRPVPLIPADTHPTHKVDENYELDSITAT